MKCLYNNRNTVIVVAGQPVWLDLIKEGKIDIDSAMDPYLINISTFLFFPFTINCNCFSRITFFKTIHIFFVSNLSPFQHQWLL